METIRERRKLRSKVNHVFKASNIIIVFKFRIGWVKCLNRTGEITMNKALLLENTNKTPFYRPSPVVLKVYCSSRPIGSEICSPTQTNVVKFVI